MLKDVCYLDNVYHVCLLSSTLQEENEDMETEMRDTADKLRKAMEASARQQSDYMTAKDQLNSLEKAKVRRYSMVASDHTCPISQLCAQICPYHNVWPGAIYCCSRL